MGAFLVEGQRGLERGLRAGWVPRVLLAGASVAERAEISRLLAEAESRGARCHRMRDAELLELAGGRNAGLLTALFDLPVLPSLAQLLDRADAAAGPLLVLVDIDEPGNVGALIRTALASGAGAAVCVGTTDPFHPKAVRTSLGSSFKLPLARMASKAGLLEELQRWGIHVLAAVSRDGEPLDRAHWPERRVAVLVGNEGRGLAEDLRSGADQRVTIDLSRAADSFCVNAAAAVCLYEVQRRIRLSRLTSRDVLTTPGP